MKKTYKNPKTDIVTISVAKMIAASASLPEKVEDGQNLEEAPETDATSGNLSRRHDIWADEEEEEEY